jgi:glutathione S-transferase
MTMALKFYFHPLSSYCHKALIALYETGVAFEPVIVDLGDAASRAAFLKVWPIGKFPVIVDDAHNRTLPESTVIIEYLAQRFRGQLIPTDADRAIETRLHDRFFDNYIHNPMQDIVADRLRPADKKDPLGVANATQQIRNAYAYFEHHAPEQWIMGVDFTLADCSAAPALFYANKIVPFAPEFPMVAAYFERLKQRPSYARVLKEAEPYMKNFPVQ